MTTIRTVTRLTQPQIAHGLERVKRETVDGLKRDLEARAGQGEAFVLAVDERLAHDGLDVKSASREELLRAVARELAAVERALSTSKVRQEGETLDLATVEKRFGKTVKKLLVALEKVPHIPGRLDAAGKVRITEDVAKEVKLVYDGLKEQATDERVVAEMKKLYETFSESTLDSLHRKFAGVLPDRRLLRAERIEQALAAEAKVVARIVENQGVKKHAEIVKAMKMLGYRDFDEHRIAYLREKVGIIPPTSAEHTPEEYRALADKIEAFIAKHPAATARVLSRALSQPLGFIEDAAELHGITLSKTRTARVMDPYDPLCDVLVKRKLLERGPKGTLEGVAAALSSNKAFTSRFGRVSGEQLAKYVADFLPELKKAPKEAPPGASAKRGVYDREYALLVEFYYATNPYIGEGDVLCALKAFDPGLNKYRLRKLREDNPDLKLTVRTHDEEVRRELAEQLGKLIKAHPDETYRQIVERGVRDHGLPRVEDAYIGWLRDEFPELIEKRIDRSSNDDVAKTKARVAEYLKEHPRASVAAVAKALKLRETQVVKPMRQYRASELDAGQTRFTAADRALVERVVRGAEPGDTLGDIQQKILAEETFEKRHAGISEATVRSVIVELVPEAADWKVFNLINVARVLDEEAQKWPEGKSLSQLVAHIKQKHPGMPSYVTLLASTVKSFKKHLAKMPFLEKYLHDDGKFYFVGKREEAKLTEELARLMKQAFASAPPEWSNERIFEEMKKDPKVAAKYPVINESTLTGLRNKFRGEIEIPARAGGKKGRDDQRADAKRLAAEMAKTLAKGDKIKLDEIAARWGVDPQYFRRIINNHADLFPMYKKRYELTPHVARVIGYALSTLPMGITIEDAAKAIEASGLLPSDMKCGKTTLINAAAKYPELVPTVEARNQEMFLRFIAKEICTAAKGTSLSDIFARAREQTGILPVSYERFVKEIVPAWEKKKSERPAFVDAVVVGGKVATAALGKPSSSFPKEELAAVERDLAQLEQIPDRLEMLERIIAKKAKNAFANFNVLNVQHLLGSNYRFVEAVNRMGAKKGDIVTVGIPYSTSPTVARTMNEQGLETLTPPLNIAAWARQVEDAVFEMVEKAKKNKKQIVVFDDGGLVAKILHERPWAKEHRHLFRIVEQTTRGITVAKKYDLEVPIIDYARDPAKDLEGVMIGDVVLDRIYQRLDGVKKRKQLKGMKVTAVGAGTIGLPTAIELAKAGAKVRLYDLDPEARRRAAAEAKKHKVSLEIVDDPKAAFDGAEMIVGCTGHTSIAKEAFDVMADGCMLVSTSSKLVEIDMGLLDEKAREGGELRREIVADGNHPPTCVYTLDDGRKITVFADGFPVNFDGAVNCVDPADIQLTHAGMLLSGIQATWDDLPHGFVRFDDKLRKDLVADWQDVKRKRAPP